MLPNFSKPLNKSLSGKSKTFNGLGLDAKVSICKFEYAKFKIQIFYFVFQVDLGFGFDVRFASLVVARGF